MTKLPVFDLDPDAKEFRQEVREWLRDNWNEQHLAEHKKLPFERRGWDKQFSRALGARGWIGVGWPQENGGLGVSPEQQLVLSEELEYAQAPIGHVVGDAMIAPSIIKFGSETQKATYLPMIQSGEIYFGLGYSEPEAGSDLASLKTRAVRQNGGWLINGLKLWSTGTDKSDLIWVAARTDPDAKPRHAGISVFIVPTNAEGLTISPGFAMYGKTFCELRFDDVWVPEEALVGDENKGWAVITNALASERVTIGATVALLQRGLDMLSNYVATAEVAGRKLRDDPVILDRLGGLGADVEAARQLSLRNIRMASQGRSPIHEASIAKVFVAECQGRLGEAALEILGTGGLLSEDAPGAPAGELEQILRHTIMQILGGGASEIQRNIIAIHGIGLPR